MIASTKRNCLGHPSDGVRTIVSIGHPSDGARTIVSLGHQSDGAPTIVSLGHPSDGAPTIVSLGHPSDDAPTIVSLGHPSDGARTIENFPTLFSFYDIPSILHNQCHFLQLLPPTPQLTEDVVYSANDLE